MITLVVPTYNRSSVLSIVIDSFYAQDKVTEIVFVNDGGNDNTDDIISKVSLQYPQIKTQYIVNKTRAGAAQSRNVGVSHAVNEYILFCDDDMYLGDNYAAICLQKLQELNAAAVSGRLIYMRDGEDVAAARNRFGDGMRQGQLFWPHLCQCLNSAVFTGDQKTPMTHAVILTKKSLLQQFPFDANYVRGNGYREESDFQMNLYVHGYDIYTTNDCCTLHLPMSQVVGGGQRVGAWQRVYWSIVYTKYFFNKYYADYARRAELKAPQWVSFTVFCLFAVYKELFRPSLYSLYLFLTSSRRQHGGDGVQTPTRK